MAKTTQSPVRKPTRARHMRKAGAGKKAAFTVVDAKVPEPRRVDLPQWEDVHGGKHHDRDSALEVNVRFAVEQVINHDAEQHPGSLNGTDIEDTVDCIVRCSQFLLVALRVPEEDDEQSFVRFMLGKFGPDWKSDTTDEGIAVRTLAREAFLAGMAQG